MNRSTYISPRTDFGKPPKGYIPGAGRGAVGFTTRSDIGPARQAVVPIDRSISAQKERARQILLQRQLGVPNASGNGAMLPATPSTLVGNIQTENKREDKYHGQHSSHSHSHNASNTNHNSNAMNTESAEDLNDSNYDPFTGYATNLFSAGSYDDEDREADLIYQTIDARQDSKRKRRREEKEKAQWEEYHKKRPKVHEYFQSEKRELADLSLDAWENIPEPMDLSRRRRKFNKSTRSEKYTPVPDSIIEGAHRGNTTGTMVDDMDSQFDGWATTAPVLGTGTATGIMTTDLTQLGRARDRHLGIQLDKMADSVTGQTVVDPKGYLTDLTSISITSETDVSDIRKARQLLKSVITTNPKHPPGWIAAARLEEAAGKLVAARSMILRGTDACPSSQDIWIEAARLHSPKEAKKILAAAVKKIPKSVKIWLKAASLEHDMENKKAVLRKALEIIPNSIILWQTAIDLEDANNARIMLSRAVECVPSSVEMWLALSKLETYENAKKVLNRARVACPSDKLIFIESAKLEEKNDNKGNIPFIISKAIKTLSANNIVINKEQWFQEAAKCENSECTQTCKEIIFQVMDFEDDSNELQLAADPHEEDVHRRQTENDKLMKYKKDAEHWLDHEKQVHVARCIYEYILRRWSENEQIWWDAAQLERKYGAMELTEEVLKRAVEACPYSINLWLLAAKIQKNQGHVQVARGILQRALKINMDPEQNLKTKGKDSKNPNKCEKIWLALCRLEIHCGNFEAAKSIMNRARSECNTDKIWLHSCKLLRQLNGGGSDEELRLELQAVDKFVTFDKLWMMLIQCYEQRKEYKKCCEMAEKAIKFVGENSINLWLEYIRILSEKLKKYAKARSILHSATLKHPKQDILWLTAAKLELEENNQCKPGELIYRNQPGYQQCKSLIAKGLQQCPESGLLYAFEIEIEPVASKKSKCVLAIKKCPNNVYVFTEVAKYFIQIRKLKRAKEWFERAIIADPTYGDAWAYYYWFTATYLQRNAGSNNGNKEQQNILQRCVSAAPKYGSLWIEISKKIGNESLSKKEILGRVVSELIEPCNGFPIQVV